MTLGLICDRNYRVSYDHKDQVVQLDNGDPRVTEGREKLRCARALQQVNNSMGASAVRSRGTRVAFSATLAMFMKVS